VLLNLLALVLLAQLARLMAQLVCQLVADL
jgi:hypothetical protein